MKRLWLIATVVVLGAATSVSGLASQRAGAQPMCREQQAAPEYRKAIAADRLGERELAVDRPRRLAVQVLDRDGHREQRLRALSLIHIRRCRRSHKWRSRGGQYD